MKEDPGVSGATPHTAPAEAAVISELPGGTVTSTMSGGRLPGPGLAAALVFCLAPEVVSRLARHLVPKIVAHVLGLQAWKSPFPLGGVTFLATAALIFVLYLPRPPRRTLALRGFDRPHLGCLLLLLLPLSVLTSQLQYVMEAAFAGPVSASFFAARAGSLSGTVHQAQGLPLSTTGLVSLVWGSVVLAPVWEELYFRAFIGRGLTARWGAGAGVFFTSVLFAVVHEGGIDRRVPILLLGIVSHAVFLWSRSLLAPLVLHAAHNGGVILCLLLPPRVALLVDPEAFQWPLALTAFASLVAVCWLYRGVRARWVLPDGTPWTPGYPTVETPPAELGARPERGSPGPWPLRVVLTAYLSLVCVIVFSSLERSSP